MYLAHFSLQQAPFALTPNTGFYVAVSSQQQALQMVLLALAEGEGFLKVVGEVGTGKTLLCRKVLHEAPANWQLAYIPDPQLTPEQLRWALALELGLQQSANIDQQQLQHLLQRQLLLFAKAGRPVVLLVDEAQALPDDTLEALRLLTNLETEQRKLLQVVLFAQPELDQRLASSRFRQLRQRITFSCQLSPLNQPEVKGYVQQRLQQAGSTLPLFSDSALWLLSYYSRGIPRLVNLLAHKALLLSYGKGLASAGCWQVWQAACDTEDVSAWRLQWLEHWLPARWLLAAGLLVCLFAGWNDR